MLDKIGLTMLIFIALIDGICLLYLLINAIKGIIGVEKNKPAAPAASEVKNVEMTNEEFIQFADADAEAAQSFRDAIAGLNAFMTGTEEDLHDVGKQEKP